MKPSLRSQTIERRRAGATYRELMAECGIAKSTLWRWLKAEGLVNRQPQAYTERRRAAQRKGAAVVRLARLQRTQAILSRARAEIEALTDRELCLIGAALYWAEGAKQREHKQQVSEQVLFSNTDPRMLRLFVQFLLRCCGVQVEQLKFRIYLHETAAATDARAYWADAMRLESIRQAPISWKRHKPATRRTNCGSGYHGLLRIIVARSSSLNRRITGWIEGLGTGVGEWCNGSTGAFGAPRPGSSPGSPALGIPGSQHDILHDAPRGGFWDIGHTDVNRLFGGSMCHERQGRYA